MKSYTKQIIEKMKDNFYPNLGWDFIHSLTNESYRGAVLIGTCKVEEQLKELLTNVLPIETKKYQNRLLNYPGAISSFSSKIELTYAFRLIDKNLYTSLNVLRKLRNEAAHSAKKFELNNIKERIDHINNFEPEFSEPLEK